MIRTAKTENGLVRGLPASDPRITSFKGIPFALPPVGENRWRKPMPCENWEGIREAYGFGPISMQDVPGLGDDLYCREWHVDPDIEMDEDCLYLNIWTPAKSTGEKLPVLVWYFGGAFQWGYTAEMELDGERLARRGIVVVSINYRLGAFGFLAHPQITKEQMDAPCNFGSLDQQAGLRWVKRNIAEFGGNPSNITIMGQSAGGASVMTQMACLQNEGAFQRAIVLSGMFRSPYRLDRLMIPKPLHEAENWGVQFFDFLGVSSLKEARELKAEYIRDKYTEFVGNHDRLTFVVDGQFLKEDPYKAFIKGERVRVPVLAGNTTDEFLQGIPAADEVELREYAEQYFGEEAHRYLSYAQARKKGAAGFGTFRDIQCGVKAAFLSESGRKDAKPCYYYRFAAEIPGEDQPGTFHSSDLWFFFETLAKCSRPYQGKHYDLARKMCHYIANFIKNGNPNGMDDDGTIMPEWRAYTDQERNEMEFSLDGPRASLEKDDFEQFLIAHVLKRETME